MKESNHKILKRLKVGHYVNDDSLRNYVGFVDQEGYCGGHVCLDGDFTVGDLRKIVDELERLIESESHGGRG